MSRACPLHLTKLIQLQIDVFLNAVCKTTFTYILRKANKIQTSEVSCQEPPRILVFTLCKGCFTHGVQKYIDL